MPKLKHVALAVKDPEEAAKFFVDVFEMQRCGRFETHRSRGCYLTDGYITIALIDFTTREGRGAEFAEDFEGLHHIGFQVEDIAESDKRIKAAGFAPRDDFNRGLQLNLEGAEIKYEGPGGFIFDISKTGWDRVAERFPDLNVDYLKSD